MPPKKRQQQGGLRDEPRPPKKQRVSKVPRPSKKQFVPEVPPRNNSVKIDEITKIIAFLVVGDTTIRDIYKVENLKAGQKKTDYVEKPSYVNLLKAVQTNIVDFMKYFSASGSMFTSSGNRPMINNTVVTSKIDLKNIENVYLFLAQKFGDLIHDLGSIKIVKAKLGIPLDSKIPTVDIFRTFIKNVEWLNRAIKNEINTQQLNGNEKFVAIESSIAKATKGDKIDEDILKDEIIKVLLNGKENTTIVEVSINDVESIRTYNPKPSIVFDQTSKGTGPNIYGQILSKFKGKATQEICLATFADMGSTQPASTIRGFSKDVRDILIYKPGEQDKFNKLSKYTLNGSPIFTTNVVMGITPVQTIILNSNEGIISQRLTLNNNKFSDSQPKSADDIKKPDVTITDCEHKTATDFNLITYAVATGAIHSTGDRSAGAINEALRLMGVRINFVNEITSSIVSMPTDIVKIRQRESIPNLKPINTLRLRMLKTKLPDTFIKNTELQKLSNAFKTNSKKLSFLIQKVQKGIIDQGTLKKIINNSTTPINLRNRLEKSNRRIFANLPKTSNKVDEPSVTNIANTNFLRVMKKQNINNEKFINTVFKGLTPLNVTRVKSRVTKGNKIMIGTLKEYMRNFNKTGNNGTTNIKKYLQMISNFKPQPKVNRMSTKNRILGKPTLKAILNNFEDDPIIKKIVMSEVNVGIQRMNNEDTINRKISKYLDFERDIKKISRNDYQNYRKKYDNTTKRRQFYVNTYKTFNAINKKDDINQINREKRKIINNSLSSTEP